MSERLRDDLFTPSGALITFLIALFALVGVFHYRAQIRDLQRRIGQLEANHK